MWIVYVSETEGHDIGLQVFESHFQGVAQKYADRRNELNRDFKITTRYSVRWEDTKVRV